MPENSITKFFYGYIVTSASFLVAMATWGANSSFGVFLKPILSEFGWTRASIAGAYSLSAVLTGVFSIIMGRLNDRFGPRLMVTVCGLLVGMGYLLMSRTSSIWQVYLFFGLIVGIGMGASTTPLLSTVARWFVSRRGMMTGIVLIGVSVGIMIWPPLSRWLISDYGWRTAFIILGTMALVIVIFAAQFLRRDPGQMGQLPYGESEAEQKSLDLQNTDFSFQKAINTRQLWTICGLFFCLLFNVGVVSLHIVPHATDLGISATIAANIVATIGGVGIAGRIVMGSAGDRIGNKPALIIGLILMPVALFWLQFAREVWMLFLFAAIYGFSFGSVGPLISPMVAELFGLRAHGAILGLVLFSGNVGGAIGSVLIGHIFDVTGSYQPGFFVSGALGIASVILCSLIRPTHRQPLSM